MADRDALLEAIARAIVHLDRAELEATHGKTANPAFIDKMVSFARAALAEACDTVNAN